MHAGSSKRAEVPLGELERVRRAPVPLAAIAFLLALIPIELTVSRHRLWFADHASWVWETKTQLIRDGVIDGDVAVIGTSVTLRGIDPTLARAESGGRYQPVNLAHIALGLQGYAQTWEDDLAHGTRKRLVFAELRELEISRASWTHGPYFLHEARLGWFLESGVLWFEPSLLLQFAADRLLPSLAYRDGLGNWLGRSLEQRRLVTETRDRNLEDTAVIGAHQGYSPMENHPRPGRNGRLPGIKVPPPRPRPFRWSPAGKRWLDRFLEVSERHGVEVVLLELPVPPYVAADRARSGYAADRDAFLASLRASHPGLRLETFAPEGFVLDDFCDDLHLTGAGADRLSAQFSHWLQRWSAAVAGQ